VTMSLRLDESSGRLPNVRVLMLLDRQADIHLAKRCAANGYLVKPLNPLSLKRAARAILQPRAVPADPVAEETPEEEPAPVG
jgi:DNA-binding response OmpR family regulator